MRILIVSFLLSIAVGVFAQTPTVSDSTKVEDFFSYLSETSKYSGFVIVRQDPAIESIIKKHIEFGEKREGFPGYRIRIFSDLGYSARKDAENTRALFMKEHPDVPNYLLYDDPNFKVVVGDYRTKSEALKFLKEITVEYPNAFIIKDLINCPKTQ